MMLRYLSFQFPISLLFLLCCYGWSEPAKTDGWNPNTRAANVDSITQTRHNLTMSYLPPIAGNGSIMDNARNNYVEICVYCHTPHASNSQIDAPLWNRTINSSTYQIYELPRTLNRPVSQPGPNSLTCLSCHDGTIAIDSIINMPGSGNYDPSQMLSVNTAFLDTWNNAAAVHATLGYTANSDQQCTYCHSATGVVQTFPFEAFVIEEDLTNDHPVGILYPDNFTMGVDFSQPNLTYTNTYGSMMMVFDNNGNQKPDKDEVRLYNSGDGPEVECASCHDPHGVPSGEAGSKFNPSFLRINNGVTGSHAGISGVVSAPPSALCLTCHIK